MSKESGVNLMTERQQNCQGKTQTTEIMLNAFLNNVLCTFCFVPDDYLLFLNVNAKIWISFSYTVPHATV